MNSILTKFGRARVLLPVIHCIGEKQAREAADVAFAAGADGVFLINQGGMPPMRVAQTAGLVSEVHPFVGVNILGEWSHRAPRYVAHHQLDAIWSDRSEVPVRERDDDDVLWSGLFFGGVAFKYQAAVDDLLVGPAAHHAALAGVDVVTTSGPATGSPPSVEKIVTMRAALGDHALAIASGITPENVTPFLAYANAFLVATGIEQRFGSFDPAKVKALADAIHGGTP